MRQIPAPLLLALALVVLAPLGASAQVIEVSPMSFDFGPMDQQQTRTTTVTVTNKGAGTLQIEDVHADCGCTVPTLDTRSLGPGESTLITIEFSSKKFNGHVVKAVNISSNDPLNPQVTVMITAEVFAPMVIDPVSQRIGFTQSLSGEVMTRRAVFTKQTEGPLEISAAGTRKGLFEVKVINNLDGNPRTAALEVTLPADIEPGQHRDNIRVETNVPEMPTADFEIQCWVQQELTASPARVTYRFKKSLDQSIRVAPFRKGTAFKVTKVESDLPELAFEVVETIPNAETKIVVSGTPVGKDDPRAVAASGRMSGTITIHTDLKSTPVIEIPVTYMVRM
ncbi:DUF1573 domain-containing protein [bacterium]|nr:DUF1573 domain-containing protein [bacterium]